MLALFVLVNWFVIYVLFGLFNAKYAIIYSTAVILILVIFSVSSLAEAINRLVHGCRKPTKDEMLEIAGAWQVVLERAGLVGKKGLPDIFITYAKEPNAFALGSRTVCVTRGLLYATGQDELIGILAHELGHLQLGDCRRRTIIVVINKAANAAGVILATILVLSGFFVPVKDFVLYIMGFGALVLKGLLWLLRRAIDIGLLAGGGNEEFRADEYAKKLGLGSGLVKYLRKLEALDTETLIPVRIERLR